MARFLALYRSSTSAQEQMANVTPEQAQAGIEAWQAWAAKAGTAIVDLGAPVSGGQRLRLAGSLARRPPRGRQTPLPQLSEQAQAMVPGQHLEAIWLLGAGAGDQVLDQPELLNRPADLLQPAPRNAIRVPLRLNEATDINLDRVQYAPVYRRSDPAKCTFVARLGHRSLDRGTPAPAATWRD